jgi:hypothetical protein
MEYEEFKKILKKYQLTLKKFSELSEVSYKTCTKWGKEDRPVPNWVGSWFKLYSENKLLKESKELKNDDCEEYKRALAKALQDNLT